MPLSLGTQDQSHSSTKSNGSLLTASDIWAPFWLKKQITQICYQCWSGHPIKHLHTLWHLNPILLQLNLKQTLSRWQQCRVRLLTKVNTSKRKNKQKKPRAAKTRGKWVSLLPMSLHHLSVFMEEFHLQAWPSGSKFTGKVKTVNKSTQFSRIVKLFRLEKASKNFKFNIPPSLQGHHQPTSPSTTSTELLNCSRDGDSTRGSEKGLLGLEDLFCEGIFPKIPKIPPTHTRGVPVVTPPRFPKPAKDPGLDFPPARGFDVCFLGGIKWTAGLITPAVGSFQLCRDSYHGNSVTFGHTGDGKWSQKSWVRPPHGWESSELWWQVLCAAVELPFNPSRSSPAGLPSLWGFSFCFHQ